MGRKPHTDPERDHNEPRTGRVESWRMVLRREHIHVSGLFDKLKHSRMTDAERDSEASVEGGLKARCNAVLADAVDVRTRDDVFPGKASAACRLKAPPPALRYVEGGINHKRREIDLCTGRIDLLRNGVGSAVEGTNEVEWVAPPSTPMVGKADTDGRPGGRSLRSAACDKRHTLGRT
jgi:hypothetical protein